MDNVMQGYDLDAAVCQIGKAIGKAAKAAPDAAAAFARRAIEADMRYMHETGVLDDDGLMGDGEYDEDDAFEALFAEMTDGLEDDGEIILLKVEEEANGDTYLCPIENAKEFDEIQAIFEERLQDLFNEDEE